MAPPLTHLKDPAGPLTGEALALLVLRLWLAARALGAGIEKYATTVKEQQPLIDAATGMEDPSGAMVEVSKKVYGLAHYHGLPPALETKFAAEPLLPGWALSLFGTVLGPALIILGFTTLLGIAPRTSLFLQGLLYTALTFGLMLINQNDGVAWLAIHVGLVAFALTLSAHQRFVVWNKF